VEAGNHSGSNQPLDAVVDRRDGNADFLAEHGEWLTIVFLQKHQELAVDVIYSWHEASLAVSFRRSSTLVRLLVSSDVRKSSGIPLIADPAQGLIATLQGMIPDILRLVVYKPQ